MRRAPIVLAGTAAGLAGVLSYTTSSPSSSATAGSSPAVALTQAATPSASPPGRSSGTASATTSSQTPARKRSRRVRTATGEDVSYHYGDLQVKVTERGSRITKVSVLRLDVRDPRSESIDDLAIPELTREVIAAQSAKIDTVSGASYTSAAYAESLQAALDRL